MPDSELHIALGNGNSELASIRLRALREQGYVLTRKETHQLLKLAVLDEDDMLSALLTEWQVDANVVDDEGESVLRTSYRELGRYGHFDDSGDFVSRLQVLIDHSNVELRDDHGVSFIDLLLTDLEPRVAGVFGDRYVPMAALRHIAETKTLSEKSWCAILRAGLETDESRLVEASASHCTTRPTYRLDEALVFFEDWIFAPTFEYLNGLGEAAQQHELDSLLWSVSSFPLAYSKNDERAFYESCTPEEAQSDDGFDAYVNGYALPYGENAFEVFGLLIHRLLERGAGLASRGPVGGHTALERLLASAPTDGAKRFAEPLIERLLPPHAGTEQKERAKNELFQLLEDSVVDGDGHVLHQAARLDCGEIVRAFVAFGSDVNATNDDGWTALHTAAFHGHARAMQILLDAGANIHAREEDGWTALHRAAFHGHVRITHILLDAGANINATTEIGSTALMLAAQEGHDEVVITLLQYNADIEATSNKGWTALHRAAYHGHLHVIQTFLDAGANIHAREEYGWTALMFAAEEGHDEVVITLLQHNADIEASSNNGWTALHAAAFHGHPHVLHILLDAGANVHARNDDALTALMLAAEEGDDDVVSVLISHGADLRATKADGRTALHIAVRGGHEGIVKLLLDAGANIHAVTESGETALVNAAADGHEGIVRILLANGADPHAQREGGATAVALAMQNGHQGIVDLLLDTG